MKKKISFWYTDTLTNPEDSYIYHWLTERYDVVLDEISPDFLFYDVFGENHLNYRDSVKIFLPGEDEIPNFNQCDYATGFVDLSYQDRYFYHNHALDKITPNFQDRSSITGDLVKRKFCNFIYSNRSSGEGAILRQELCKLLMKYKRVDCPGRVLNNMDRTVINDVYIGDWEKSKINFQKQYKFSFACENDATDGWTTEKMPDAFQAFSIPIYYGNPNIVRDFNPKAFINVADYDFDLNKVVERIIYLDTHDDEYLKMLKEPPLQKNFRYYDVNKYKEWIYHIIEKGRRPFNKDPRNLTSKDSWGKTIEWYREKVGMKDTSLVGKLRDIIFAADVSQKKLDLFLEDYLRKKYRFRFIKYWLFKNLTFGRIKGKYKRKYAELENKVKTKA